MADEAGPNPSRRRQRREVLTLPGQILGHHVTDPIATNA